MLLSFLAHPVLFAVICHQDRCCKQYRNRCITLLRLTLSQIIPALQREWVSA